MTKLITIVIDSLQIGGTRQQVRKLLPGLQSDGWRIRVHALFGTGQEAYEWIPGVEVYEPAGRQWLMGLGRPGKLLLVAQSMVVLWRTMLVDKPAFVYTCEPSQGYRASLLCASAAGFHRLILNRRGPCADQPKHAWTKQLDRYLYARAYMAIANTPRVLREFADVGIETSRCALIHDDFDIDRFDANARGNGDALACSKKIITIACMANSVPYEGYSDLLKAFVRLEQRTDRQLELLFIGRDDRTIRELASSLGVGGNVIWLGTREDIPAHLAACQIGVLPSRNEDFSNVVLEYMAAGLAIVATRVAGRSDHIAHGECGLLVEPGKPDALAEALQLLVDDMDLRSSLGNAARLRVQSLFKLVGRYQEFHRCLQLNDPVIVLKAWVEYVGASARTTIRPQSIPETLDPGFRLLCMIREDPSCWQPILLQVVRQGDPDLVSLTLSLMNYDAEIQRAGLAEAVRLGNGAIARQLHESGAVIEELSTESERTLRAMKEEIDAADPIYTPSKFWDFLGNVGNKYLRWGGERHFKQSINQSFFNFVPLSWRDRQMVSLFKRWLSAPGLDVFGYTMAPCVSDPPWYAGIDDYNTFGGERSGRSRMYKLLMVLLHHHARRSEIMPLLEYLDEPTVGNPISVKAPDGKLISQDLINSCREYSVIKRALPPVPFGSRFTIGELGAGYGRLGYVFLSALNCRYVVFDIPPALHIAQWYLSSLFPQKAIFNFRHFDDFVEIETELANSDIGFFTSNQLELFPANYFDTFVNISSLHEMRRDQIDQFVALVAEKTRYNIYSKQYRHYHNPYDHLDIVESDYRFPAEWQIKETHVDTLNPRFFESTLIRTPVCNLVPPNDEAEVVYKPSVAILLSNYNHANYLSESLDAICGQTRSADEIIVLDDGSTDGSVALIKEYCKRDATIRFVRNDRNKGLMYSINRLLRMANADYIVWASADDKLLPDFLEKGMAMLERHSGAGLCFSRLCVLEDATGEVRKYDEVSHGKAFDLGAEPRFFTPDELDERLEESYLWMSGNTVVARRDAIIEAGGFHRSARWHADWMTFYIVALRYGVVTIPENLALIRERPATYSGAGMARAREQLYVLRSIISILRNPAFRDIRKIVRRRPSLLSLFGYSMIFALISSVKDWDILLAFVKWNIRILQKRMLRRFRSAVNTLGRIAQATVRRVEIAVRSAVNTLGRIAQATVRRVEIAVMRNNFARTTLRPLWRMYKALRDSVHGAENR